MLTEPTRQALPLHKVEYPNCKARILFRRVPIPHIDEQGFESYAFNCNFCRSCLVGVVDPCDGALLLSIVPDKVEDGAALTPWRQAWPLAGLAVAAAVNVFWVGVLGYALVRLV